MLEFWQTNNPSKMTPAESARAVEADGWDGQVFTDSQCLTADPYVVMGAWAMATERLKLACFCTNPLTRHLAVTAAATASLHAISGGRAVLGIGRGDSALAYLGLAPVSLASFEQSLRELQALLRGEAVAFESGAAGAASLATMSLGDRPTATRIEWLPEGLAKVPVDVAVTGPKAIELSARLAERVTFSVGAMADRLLWARDVARAARTSEGLTEEGIGYGAQIVVVCHPDPQTAYESSLNLVPSLARFQVMQTDLVGPRSAGDEENYDAIRRGYDMTKHAKRSGAQGKLVGASISRDFIDRFAIVGPPDHCIERMLGLIACGIERFVIVGPGLHPEAAAPGRTLFQSEVVPALRGAVGS